MKSNASIAGHPLHAIFVAIPIGLWSFALVADLLAYFMANPLPWKLLAFCCIGGGIAGAVLAGITGFIDYLGIPSPRIKRVAAYHMIVNLAGIGLYLASFCLRWKATPEQVMAALPVGLAVAGFLLIGLGGWLGGELVYRFGVGVNEVEEEEPETRRKKRSHH